jgi:hypothetical protein
MCSGIVLVLVLVVSWLAIVGDGRRGVRVEAGGLRR